jgi:hypothetical protein
MADNKKTCPLCADSENIYKVSEIYIQSLVRLKHGDEAEAPIIDRLQAEIPEERRGKLKGSRYYRQLMESFAPPQGENQSTRAINPDWIAFGALLISLFFLYEIYSTQHEVFWYMVAFALVAFACYGIFRKTIIAKYQLLKSQETGTKGKIEKAVGLWMKTYYCAKDNVIFGIKKDETIPIDQMRTYLLASEKSKT